jgi:uncharacterized protein YegL
MSIQLLRCVESIVFAACKALKADIVFLLDTSSSEGATNFAKMKEFVTSFVNTFDIGPTGVEIGVVTFSTSPHREFDLKTYLSKSNLLHAISRVAYRQGNTQTAAGLDYVRSHSFSSLAGNRTDAPDIVFVLTDGRSTSATRTRVSAANLHDAGVKTFAIGIGPSVIQSELRYIASDSHHVFSVASFDVLHTLQAELVSATCGGNVCYVDTYSHQHLKR